VVAPLATNSCGTFSAFRYGRVAWFCSVPRLLKMAKTLSCWTSSRVCSLVRAGS
jgi:hypothetical protein